MILLLYNKSGVRTHIIYLLGALLAILPGTTNLLSSSQPCSVNDIDDAGDSTELPSLNALVTDVIVAGNNSMALTLSKRLKDETRELEKDLATEQSKEHQKVALELEKLDKRAQELKKQARTKACQLEQDAACEMLDIIDQAEKEEILKRQKVRKEELKKRLNDIASQDFTPTTQVVPTPEQTRSEQRAWKEEVRQSITRALTYLNGIIQAGESSQEASEFSKKFENQSAWFNTTLDAIPAAPTANPSYTALLHKKNILNALAKAQQEADGIILDHLTASGHAPDYSKIRLAALYEINSMLQNQSDASAKKSSTGLSHDQISAIVTKIVQRSSSANAPSPKGYQPTHPSRQPVGFLRASAHGEELRSSVSNHGRQDERQPNQDERLNELLITTKNLQEKVIHEEKQAAMLTQQLQHAHDASKHAQTELEATGAERNRLSIAVQQLHDSLNHQNALVASLTQQLAQNRQEETMLKDHLKIMQEQAAKEKLSALEQAHDAIQKTEATQKALTALQEQAAEVLSQANNQRLEYQAAQTKTILTEELANRSITEQNYYFDVKSTLLSEQEAILNNELVDLENKKASLDQQQQALDERQQWLEGLAASLKESFEQPISQVPPQSDTIQAEQAAQVLLPEAEDDSSTPVLVPEHSEATTRAALEAELAARIALPAA